MILYVLVEQSLGDLGEEPKRDLAESKSRRVLSVRFRWNEKPKRGRERLPFYLPMNWIVLIVNHQRESQVPTDDDVVDDFLSKTFPASLDGDVLGRG